MYDPKKYDPHMILVYHITGLKEVLAYINKETEVKPNMKNAYDYHHAEVMICLDMIRQIQLSIEQQKDKGD
jgi:hypothetical protein